MPEGFTMEDADNIRHHFILMVHTAVAKAHLWKVNGDGPSFSEGQTCILRELTACLFSSLNRIQQGYYAMLVTDRSIIGYIDKTSATEVTAALLEILSEGLRENRYTYAYLRLLYDNFIFRSLHENHPGINLRMLYNVVPHQVLGGVYSLAELDAMYRFNALNHMGRGSVCEDTHCVEVNTARIREGVAAAVREYKAFAERVAAEKAAKAEVDNST